MKICVVGTRGFPEIQGGVEKHCEALYTAMCTQFDIKVIVFRRKPYAKTSPYYKNIQFIDLPSTKIKGIETILHSLLATCVSILQKPDIIHFHNIGPAMFSPLVKLFGIKVVLTYHSANYEHKKWGKSAKLLLKISEKIALAYSDKIIFVNQFQMEKSKQKYKHKYAYIPNGIPHVQQSNKTDFLQTLKLESRKYILAVGRITPEKGFDILIKAFSKIETQYKLVIAGGVETEINYFKELKNMIDPEKIVFTGYTTGDNLNQLYSNAAFFVLSSRNEGFPIVLLEAMAYQLDVLVSDIPATHLVELQENDYFKLENENSLIKGIMNKTQNISRRKYDLSNFSWEKISKEVYMIYSNIKRH